jgi:hypothetical protein
MYIIYVKKIGALWNFESTPIFENAPIYKNIYTYEYYLCLKIKGAFKNRVRFVVSNKKIHNYIYMFI